VFRHPFVVISLLSWEARIPYSTHWHVALSIYQIVAMLLQSICSMNSVIPEWKHFFNMRMNPQVPFTSWLLLWIWWFLTSWGLTVQGWRTCGTRRSMLSHFFYLFCSTSVSLMCNICVSKHTPDCIQILYELPSLPNNTMRETFLHKSGAVWSVDWIFIIGTPGWRWLGEYVTLDKTFLLSSFQTGIISSPSYCQMFFSCRVYRPGLC
jgi:hypothetical protein